MIRLLIIAPTLAMRAGLRALLSNDDDIEITGEAPNWAGLEGFVTGVDVIVDAASAYAGAVSRRGIQSLLVSDPAPAMLLVSDDPQSARALPGLPLRAWGVLPLDASGEEMTAAIHALSEGLVVGAPHLLENMWRPSQNGSAIAGEDYIEGELVEPLTARETEVLRLLGRGLANKQIARQLNISEHTVKFHISSLYTKLGATNRTEAVRIGVRRGLISL